ncbi:hypothetical protein E3U23_03785 [Erythrobacter litoralis]|uniref:hypothetical protein n=1 Tax=Erythrobacter litoralis TaxID=39960 RepID=UPI002435DA68|nr:hypothetical protein [Erythrobacter litoralis]MDG6078310.1 hypothetical protein [Erythrobacter litoralis]
MKAFTIFAVSTAALALAACSDQQDETPITQEAADDMDVAAMDDDAMPVGGELNETQQASYDAMDRQAVSDEYDTNRDTMMAESANSGAMASNTSMQSDMEGDTATSSTPAPSATNTAAPLPARSQMDFAYLDRNDDGQLSVAEYAIWAVRANPNTSVANDQTKPYISTDQINEAGQTFFYFDEDGDSYLSNSEFTTARNSSRTPNTSSM